MPLTVLALKEALKDLPDDMAVVLPNVLEDDKDIITGFKYLTTMGIISNVYEPEKALCLSSSDYGLDISGQIERTHIKGLTPITWVDKVIY